MASFISSLGEEITKDEELQVLSADNVEAMTESINKIRDKYLKPPVELKEINVNKVDSTNE